MPDVAVHDEPELLARQRAAIGRALGELCTRNLGDDDSLVGAAIRYSLLGEGKRMRGNLFLSAFSAAGGTGDASALAAAIEVVHAYSLVHDDLPCMDDDDVRRGRPTVHRVYGVAAATAAGLAMVPLAARCAAESARALGLDDAAVGAIVADLMRASGAGGMIGGQLLDLEGEGRPLALADLERIHRAKTGALITAAATLGGRAASASPNAHRGVGPVRRRRRAGLPDRRRRPRRDGDHRPTWKDGGSRSCPAQEHLSGASRAWRERNAVLPH